MRKIETLAPCTFPSHTPPHPNGVTARIIGITALVSFVAGATVATACNSQDEPESQSQHPQKTRSLILVAPAPPAEEQKMKHMLFPEMDDLLYRREPKSESSDDKDTNEDEVTL